jgi:hypothetical protein
VPVPKLTSLDNLPLDALAEIDQLRKRFEATWRAGEQPCLADYLASAAGIFQRSRAASPGGDVDGSRRRHGSTAGHHQVGPAAEAIASSKSHNPNHLAILPGLFKKHGQVRAPFTESFPEGHAHRAGLLTGPLE